MLPWFRTRSGAGPEDPYAAAARRFRDWMPSSNDNVYTRADAALDAFDRAAFHESLLADLAAFLGEAVREEHGGDWRDAPLHGPVVQGLGDIPQAVYHPLALAEKKAADRSRFSLAGFHATLPRRLEAEATKPQPTPASSATGGPPAAVARDASEQLRAFWNQRFRVTLPLSLTGVRELDGFLRSHYFISLLPESFLFNAGCLVGEVARGLFGGEWAWNEHPRPDRIALRWPELDYYPVGRIYKMMTARPEGEPLDEYIRLVPSARAELRKSP